MSSMGGLLILFHFSAGWPGTRFHFEDAAGKTRADCELYGSETVTE